MLKEGKTISKPRTLIQVGRPFDKSPLHVFTAFVLNMSQRLVLVSFQESYTREVSRMPQIRESSLSPDRKSVV